MAPHPAHVVLLTADAFGVMPPVARLSTAQSLYHFLSGYTSKLAGTEVGLTEPEATLQLLLRRAVHGPQPDGLR